MFRPRLLTHPLFVYLCSACLCLSAASPALVELGGHPPMIEQVALATCGNPPLPNDGHDTKPSCGITRLGKKSEAHTLPSNTPLPTHPQTLPASLKPHSQNHNLNKKKKYKNQKKPPVKVHAPTTRHQPPRLSKGSRQQPHHHPHHAHRPSCTRLSTTNQWHILMRVYVCTCVGVCPTICVCACVYTYV
jgi:hypothetical protein